MIAVKGAQVALILAAAVQAEAASEPHPISP